MPENTPPAGSFDLPPSQIDARQTRSEALSIDSELMPTPVVDSELRNMQIAKMVPLAAANKAIPDDSIKMTLGVSDPAQDRRKSRFPRVGEECFGFRLWYALGAGAFGKVFLAEQIGLANRPVVLKITDRVGDEPQVLAQLQHANIVPIYSVHENQAGLRAVCMPYFGGATLLSILSEIKIGTLRSFPKFHFLDLLDLFRSPSLDDVKKSGIHHTEIPPSPLPISIEHGNSLRKRLRALNETQIALWIFASLADGLQHAHDRGILHRDIKPANILIADDGQPMLLDFNLSRDVEDPGSGSFGGTIAYMSPEALRAMLTRKTEDIGKVDHRSDIYSLGMVFVEFLAGNVAAINHGSYSMLPASIENLIRQRSEKSPSLREIRKDASWGLESIVRKILAPDPKNRYQRSENLAEDLRRYAADLPLKFAPEISSTEVLAKWRRRNPRIAIISAFCFCLIAIVSFWVVLRGTTRHLRQISEELADTRSHERMMRYQTATNQVLMLVNVNTELQEPLRKGIDLCEQTLGIYGILDWDDWQKHPDWRRLTPEEQKHLAEDTRELLQSLAWSRVRTMANGDTAAIQDSLRLLEKAESIAMLPPSPALALDKSIYLGKLSRLQESIQARDEANRLKPISARDHYQLATSLIRTGTIETKRKAIEELNQAIAINPKLYWAWFERGVCRINLGDHAASLGQTVQAMGEYQLASADFGACIALWPEFVWGHFNLGCSLDRGGRVEESLQAYEAVIKADPNFSDARLNRGLIYLATQRPRDALRELEKAFEIRPDDPSINVSLGIALEGTGRSTEADSAFSKALMNLTKVSPESRIKIRLSHGFSVYQRNPSEAIDSFQNILKLDPNQSDALYGLGMVMAHVGKDEEAAKYLFRCVEATPNRKDASLFWSILQSRAGKHAQPIAMIKKWLDRDPNDGETLYASACVYSLASQNTRGEADSKRYALEASDLLRKAIARGQQVERARKDPDLKAIQDRVELKNIFQTK